MKNLKLEILVQNESNKFSRLLIADLLPQLKPFISKKIFLADGRKSRGLNPNYLRPDKLTDMYVLSSTYLRTHCGKLELVINYSINGGSYDVQPVTAFTKNITKYIYLGNMVDYQILETLIDIDTILKDNDLYKRIDLFDELTKIDQLKKLEEQANAIRRTIQIDKEFYKYL